MAIISRTNSKVIKDPLFTPVLKFLKERIAQLEIDDPDNELELARQRYTGLIAGDLVIEDPIEFPDSITRVCIVSRKTGFARADVEVKRVTVKEVLEDFAVPFVEINTVDDLKTFAKAAPVEATLLWLNYANTYGVMLNQDNAKTMSGMQKAFGGLFFNTFTSTRDSLTSIDYDTLESGTVRVTDPAFGMGEYPLFIYELVKAEADLPEITSNLPTEITSRRGQNFSIPNTYWFGGIEDITLIAQIDLSTDSGYTIPRRSDDKLTLDAETIFGATDKEVTDFITVRVTHMYMGRPVKKTFRIKVIIEQDEKLDLTFEVVPSEITATQGDVVEVVVKALFQGNPVTLNIPATQFESKKHYGNLIYVETLPDGSMTYRGTIGGALPTDKDQDTELYQAEFQYSDSGTLYKAPAYVNMTVVKPAAKPVFTIATLTSTLRGYKDEEGMMLIEARYGKPGSEDFEVISPKDLGIRLGVKGSKNLVEYLEVTDEGVRYKFRIDSGIDGQSVLDTFKQTFTWVDPQGVRYSPERDINVEARRKSSYSVQPGPTPLSVKRYQSGSLPFSFTLNGDVRNDLVTGLKVVGDNNYIYTEPLSKNIWRVLRAETTGDTPVVVKFEFFVVIDGVNTRFEFDQDFIVLKYTSGDNAGPEDEPGENTNIVAVPPLMTVAGKTDETGKYAFKVFEGPVDISSSVRIVDLNSVIPEQLLLGAMTFNDTTGFLELNYTKIKSGLGKGRVALAKPDVLNPAPADRAVVSIDADIEQARTFKVISWPDDLRGEVEEHLQFKPVFEFAGVNVPLNDPNLVITKTKTSDVDIVSIGVDALEVADNYWRYVGREITVGTELTLVYTDPLNAANKTTIVRNMVTAIVFPALVLEYDKEAINAKIWDAGTFPIKLMAGTKDWTSATTSVNIIGNNKYISINRYNWSVIWAELTATTTTLPLRIEWRVGGSASNFVTDAVFNLEAWDQVTFGIDYDPKTITLKSGQTGEITAAFVFKGQNATNNVTFMKGASTIPDTIDFVGDGVYDADRGLFVLQYTTKRGGDYPMNLVFKRTNGTETITAPITTEIEWPDGLNIVTTGGDIRGFYQDEITYPLTINISGQPLELTSPNVQVLFDSGTGDPISLKEVRDNSLILSLDEGGDEATDYNYPVNVKVIYTDVATGTPDEKEFDVDGTIRISAITIRTNPTESVHVYDSGAIRIVLADERNRVVAIEEYLPRGTNPYVAFETPDSWYVAQGSKTQAIETSLPLTLRYMNGGLMRSIDAAVLFNVAVFDGIDFKAKVAPTELEGKAGLSGELKFTFTYKGKPYTTAVMDDAKSSIPLNLAVLPFDQTTGGVTYTLVGQADDSAKFVFTMSTAGATPVEGIDQVTLLIPVSSTSSDENFTLESHSDSVDVLWKGRDLLLITMKYGEYDLPANAPGLKYTITGLNGAGDTYVAVTTKTKDGIYIRGDRSNIPGGVENFNFKLDIEYEVGAPTPKTATFNFDAKITMGQVVITNNDDFRDVNIWDKGSFWQGLKTDQASVVVDHFELDDPNNKYVELTLPRGYEIIGAELTTATQAIPMKAFYKVDATEVLQSVSFDSSFRIRGSGSVRFKVTPTPTKIETGLDLDTTVTFLPVYKDQNVGARAIFKQELSTIPPQVTIKSHRVVGDRHEIVFTGAKGGVSTTDLVFWSPDAGSAPNPRDVVTVSMETRVLGELTLEIGDRDNLLTGEHLDTGTYKLQVLFGLIPVDIADEMTKGNMTITRETGALTLPNAFVLNPSSWHADTFDYELRGPVAPGQAVNVSDFLNVTYKFGGQNYTRRVEIPMLYTTPAPTAISGNTFGTLAAPLAMWSTRALNPVLSCAGLTITNASYPLQRMTYTAAGKGSYVHVTDELTRMTSIEGSTTTPLVGEVIPFRFFSTYRNWEYQADIDTSWWIAAWDGKTFWVNFLYGTDNVSPNVDTDFLLRIQQFYRGVQIYADLIDYDLTDFGGLVDIKSAATESGSGLTWTKYTARAADPGQKAIPITFRRIDGDKPGVLNLDYAVATLTVNIVVPPLVLSGFTNPISGGNQDKVSAGTPRVTLAGTNIPINDPNLTIAFENENAIKLDSKTATALTYEVTAPLDTVIDTIIATKLTFTYVSPVTGRTHSGDFSQSLKYRLPDDYPKWPTRLTSIQLPNQFTYAGLPFNVTNSTGSLNTQLQLVSLTPSQLSGGWAMLNPDWVSPSADQVFILGRPVGDNLIWRYHTFTFKAPFRDTWIDGTCDIEYMSYVTGAAQFATVPVTANVEAAPVGEEFEVAFNINRYGKPYLSGYLSIEDSKTANLNEPLSKYFDYVSQRDNGTTTFIKFRTKLSYSGVMNYYFMINQDVPVADRKSGITVATAAVTMAGAISTVPNPGDPKLIFRRYNLPFKVISGVTDITATDVTLVSVAGPNGIIGTPEDHNSYAMVSVGTAGSPAGTWGDVVYGKGPLFMMLKCGTVDEEVELTFVIRTSAAFGNKTMTVVQTVPTKAWDQIQFKLNPLYINLYHDNVVSLTSDTPVYDEDGNLILAFPYYDGNPTSGQITYEGQFLGPAYPPGTKMGGTWGSMSLSPQQSLINTSSDGLMSWVSGGGTTAWANALIKANLVGEKVGGFGADVVISSTPGALVNYYPQRTQDKNAAILPVKYIAFPAALSWKDDVAPGPVSGKFNDAVKIQTNGLMFGPIREVNMKGITPENFTITSLDLNIASIYNEPSSRGKDFFSISLRYNNTGTDITVDLPLRFTWRPASGKTVVFDYIQKVTITGTGTVDPVPTVVEITPQTTSIYKSSATPGFKINYNGQVITPTYSTPWMTNGASIEPNGYIEYMTKPSTVWTCVNADTEEKQLDVKYIFTFSDGVRSFPMEVIVPFTIAAWDQNNYVLNSGSLAPVKIYEGGNVNWSGLLEYKTTGVNALNQWDVRKAEFELMNPGLIFVSKSLSSGANWPTCALRTTVPGTYRVKIPIHYTGTDAATPEGQLGENYIVPEYDLVVYEEKLYFFPGDVEPAQVTGNFGDKITIPLELSVGMDVNVNKVTPVTSSMQWQVPATSLITKGIASATGIDFTVAYDNRGADIVVDVPMYFFLTTFNGRTINSRRDWNQKLLIKGTGAGDTTTAVLVSEVTGAVWSQGNLPFSIDHNEVRVTSGQYKSITVKPNPYVRTVEGRPTSGVGSAYEIYAGELTPTVAVATFVVVFNDGYKDVTLEQDITFNIAAYDGKEFVMTLRNPATWNNGIVGAINANASLQVWGTYRGKNITAAEFNTLYGVWDSKTNLPGFKQPPVSKRPITPTIYPWDQQYLFCTYEASAVDMQVSVVGDLYFGLVGKENDPTAVEGVDYVILKVPSYVYISDKYYPREGFVQSTELEGKYGLNNTPKYNLKFAVRQGITNRTNIQAGYADVTGVIATDSNNIFADNINVWFSSELTTKPKEVTDMFINIGGADVTKRAKFPIKVTQISNLTFPEISNVQDVTAGIAESGTIPFTVMAGEEDYTSRTTITEVSDNPYIGSLNGKWIVQNAPAVETEVTVTLKVDVAYTTGNVPLEQTVKFTVKPWDGSVIFTDVKSVDCKVWDKGTEVPFKVKAGGIEVPASWITGMTLVSPNNFVVGGASYTDNWQVVDGDLTQDVTEPVVYTVVVNTGKVTVSPTQTVLFNIEKYDGIEYKLILTIGGTGEVIPEGIFKIQSNSTNRGLYLKTWYRGVIGVDGSRRISDSAGAGLTGLALQSGGATMYYHVSSTTGVNRKSTITINARRDGATDDAPGKGTTTIVIPVAIYTDANYIVMDNTNEVGGKFGEEADVRVLATTSDQLVDLTNPVHTFAFTPNTAIELVPSSVTPTGFKVRFLADVDEPVTTAVTVTFTNSVTNTLNGTFVLNVTQLPSAVPEISDVQDITAKIWDKGPLPFKVMYKENDITEDCVLTSISANSYVSKGVGNTWEITDAARAESIVMPVFTVTHGTGVSMITLTQAVKFTVKGWTGNRLEITAPDSVGVVGSTGQVLISGSFGDGNLYPDTTINVSSIDGKGIVTFTDVGQGTDGGLLLTYSGDVVGTENITVRVDAVVGSGNDIEGSDFANVTFSLRILPTALTPSADFESDVIGDKYHPAVVKQGMTL